MDLFSFIQWCFRDTTSGFVTVIIAGMAVEGLVRLARALRGRE